MHQINLPHPLNDSLQEGDLEEEWTSQVRFNDIVCYSGHRCHCLDWQSFTMFDPVRQRLGSHCPSSSHLPFDSVSSECNLQNYSKQWWKNEKRHSNAIICEEIYDSEGDLLW